MMRALVRSVLSSKERNTLLIADCTDVFDSNTVVVADGADSTVDNAVYFGRPWGAYAKYDTKTSSLSHAC